MKHQHDMAKIQIKSEKLTPFGGIFPIMEYFNSKLSPVIDRVLGLRCKQFGYQYSEIIRSLMCVYLCGGSCIEDLSSHLLRTCRCTQPCAHAAQTRCCASWVNSRRPMSPIHRKRAGVTISTRRTGSTTCLSSRCLPPASSRLGRSTILTLTTSFLRRRSTTPSALTRSSLATAQAWVSSAILLSALRTATATPM